MKKRLLVILLVLITFSVGYLLFSSTKIFKKNIISNIDKVISCASEGEEIGTCVDCLTKCCSGLQGMSKLKYNSKCIELPAPGSGATCSNCGNGICDIQNDEDECNCPQDCRQDSSQQTQTYRNDEYRYSFSYPGSWEIDDAEVLGGPGFRPPHLSFMGIQEEKYDKEKDCFFTAIVTTSPKGDKWTCENQSELIFGSNTFIQCFNDDSMYFYPLSEVGKFLVFSRLSNSSCQNILESSLETLSFNN